jgi:hypothetical protein
MCQGHFMIAARTANADEDRSFEWPARKNPQR